MRKPNRSSRVRLLLLALLLLARAASAAPENAPRAPRGPRPRVDLVIALDTSSSMDGLIDSARQKVWDVVRLLGQARPAPLVRVGLLSYGNSGHPAADGWVRKESELTTDLDGLYAKLMALRTGGGDEYVARAVMAAGRMAWDQDPRTLKIVFVAGNEPANQDPQVSLEAAMRDARQRGLHVNTIYCGPESVVEAHSWRDAARLGGGRFAAIDQGQAVAIASPVDDELARLSVELSGTYVAYGEGGGDRAANQAAQDKGAAALGGAVAASRAAAKASAAYANDDWDLVDARRKDARKLSELAPVALPEPMRAMSPAERERYLAEKAKLRRQLQTRIETLAGERDAFVAKERARRATGAATLDDALNAAIKAQGEAAGLAF